MIQEFQYNQIVAPMTEIRHLWEREKKVTLPWFFDVLQGLTGSRPILSFVDIKSAFFQALHQEFKQKKLCPEYIIPIDDFFNIESLSGLLEKDHVHLSLLIFKPLGPEIIEKIKSVEKFIHQLKFVILARRDWNVENTYRSIPHFMRSRLYVDFPMSLCPGKTPQWVHHLSQNDFGAFIKKLYRKFWPEDPFFMPHEWVPMTESFKRQFPWFPVRSYCPNLFLYGESSSPNVSHFSVPDRGTQGAGIHKKCRLSIISKDLKVPEALRHSKTIVRNPDQVEMLLAQTDGKTEFIPGSISIHHHRVHPQTSGKPVSKALVNNFLAGKARGEYLWFLDKESAKNPEDILSAIFKESFDEFGFLIQKKAMLFRRDDFLKMGAFDILLTHKSLLWFDSVFRYSLLKDRDFNFKKSVFLKTQIPGLPKTHLSEKTHTPSPRNKMKNKRLFLEFESQWNIISHKYACEEKFRLCLAGLVSLVFPEGKYGGNSGRTGFNIYTDPAWFFLFDSSENPMKAQRGLFCFQNSLRRHSLRKKYLKMILTPILIITSLYNKGRGLCILWLYKVHSLVLCLFYLLRTIYCFLEFQYEKRLSGLHLKGKSKPDS